MCDILSIKIFENKVSHKSMIKSFTMKEITGFFLAACSRNAFDINLISTSVTCILGLLQTLFWKNLLEYSV